MGKENTYLASKPRYEILDGLRGVAALMVIMFHCFETYNPVFGRQIINHGYLAVDFFFVLSGFVIGYAYDDRWGKMTMWGFFKRRLVRLHPMVIAGTVIGAALFYLGRCEMFPLIAQTPLWKFALCFVMGLLMIPCGPRLDIRGWSEFNSFNGPNWSLTFEYIGNILYAVVLRRLPTVALALLCAGCAFFTLDITLGWDVFGLFPEPKYDVIGGWAITPDQLYVGFGRLLYPFLCGLVLSRFVGGRGGRRGASSGASGGAGEAAAGAEGAQAAAPSKPGGNPLGMKGGFWMAAAALVAVFALPQVGGQAGVADGLYQAAAIILIFPLVVVFGAGSSLSGERSTRICRFLGELSYPLYITHYPVMYLQMRWVTEHLDSPVWLHLGVNFAVIAVSVAMAWALHRLYDLPVRRYLTDRFLRR